MTTEPLLPIAKNEIYARWRKLLEVADGTDDGWMVAALLIALIVCIMIAAIIVSLVFAFLIAWQLGTALAVTYTVLAFRKGWAYIVRVTK